MKMRPLLAALPAFALTACNFAPKYVQPEAPVAPNLPQGAAYPALTAADTAVDALGWRDFFTDARLQQVIAKQAPKVEALQRLAKSQGDVCITTAAQLLGIRPTNLFAWLNQNRWIHRRTARSSWVAYQPRLNTGWLKHKLVKVGKGVEEDLKVVEQVMVTRKGITHLATVMQEAL